MDTSLWANRFKKLKIVDTRKKFYNEYLHKLTYHNIRGAWLLCNTKSFSQFARKYSSYQMGKYSTSLTDENFEVLKIFFELYQCSALRLRVERNTISIFSNDLELLYKVASETLKFIEPIQLSTVISESQRNLLEQGFIILKDQTDYNWRVNIRSGIYKNYQERNSLVTYFNNIGDQVKISKNLLLQFTGTNKYVSAGYFYVKDIDIVNIIRLIMPTLVRSIDRVVVQ